MRLMMNTDELLTWNSLITLQGATAAVLAVTNVLGTVIGHGFDSVRKWLALALSLAAGLAGLAAMSKPDGEAVVVAVLNGFMIAAAALGVNEAGANIGGVQRRQVRVAAEQRTSSSVVQRWL